MYNKRSDTSVLISDGVEAALQNRIARADASTSAALVEEQQINAEIAEERNKYNKALKEGNIQEMLARSVKIQQLEVQKSETQETYRTNSAIRDSAREMSKMIKKALELGDSINKWGKMTSDSIKGISNMIDSFGGDSSGLTEVSSAVDDVVSGVGSIMQGFAAGGWAGAAIAAVGAVSNIITGFSERHDARLQKHIENLQFESKKLTNIYNMLEKEFEHIIDPAKT